MSMLMVNDWVGFNQFKEMLGLTDGNLASHLRSLEKFQYVEFVKQFINWKPNTNYSATIKGKNAFKKHIEAIEQLLK